MKYIYLTVDVLSDIRTCNSIYIHFVKFLL